MFKNLYPLKFEPIYKDKIWGGNKLNTFLNKTSASAECGESWEISGVQGNISIVKNGFLAENNLQELIEVYMGELVGDKIYDEFGIEFPLLFKFIDAQDDLSIQVHPDDSLGKKRHNAFGKTEMWYVLQADNGSKLISGFKNEIDKKDYLNALENNQLQDILSYYPVKESDVFFIPAGRVHAICKGILLAEIQQTSDITYRIFDWNRKDKEGKSRELHTDLALDAIDYKRYNDYKIEYPKDQNTPNEILHNKYFTTNYIHANKKVQRDYYALDSFVVYMCISGSANLDYEESEEKTNIVQGESILIPASISYIDIQPNESCELLEVYIS